MTSFTRTAALLFWLSCILCPLAAQSQQAPSPVEGAEGAKISHPEPAAAFAQARLLLQRGQYDQAIDQLKELEAQQAGLKGLSHELGSAYYRKGDYPKAIENLKKALEESPQDNEALQLLGLAYYLAGRPAEAIPLLEKVQGWFPRTNVDASYMLGMCYVQTHDYVQARKAFARMYDVPPDSAPSYLFAARMLLRQQFEPVAEEYAQKAVALDSKLPGGHFLLGELYLFKSRVPEAIAEFQKELVINPTDAATYYKLADAYSRIQRFEDAERLLQRSIWLDSTSTGPYILMGKVLAKKGETELAVRTLQHAISMDPNNSITHHLLGQAYRDLGKNEEAERELKLAEQLQSISGAKP